MLYGSASALARLLLVGSMSCVCGGGHLSMQDDTLMYSVQLWSNWFLITMYFIHRAVELYTTAEPSTASRNAHSITTKPYVFNRINVMLL